MQFVRKGPDIPERLLQAHEDGRVVFFCGAGISYPARLPGFAGLVERLYANLAVTPNAVQRSAIKAGQFSLIAGNLVGGESAERGTQEPLPHLIIRKTMGQIFDPSRAEIPMLCQRYGVRRLDLFGSAATGNFDPAHSDLDFVVEFDGDAAHLFDRYFGLKESLEALYGRPVDLVSEGASANPYFIESLERTRRRVYESQDAETA